MKASTRRRKQIETVKEWLAKARPDIEAATHAKGWQPEFSMLIAMEQLVIHAQQTEEALAAMTTEIERLGGTVPSMVRLHKSMGMRRIPGNKSYGAGA